jgi:hypothetical protein
MATAYYTISDAYPISVPSQTVQSSLRRDSHLNCIHLIQTTRFFKVILLEIVTKMAHPAFLVEFCISSSELCYASEERLD